MGALLLIAQAVAAPGAGPARSPDIELTAHVTAREVTVQREGPIKLELRAEPGTTDAAVERSQSAGASSYRNLVIDARVGAWLGQDGQSIAAPRSISCAPCPPISSPTWCSTSSLGRGDHRCRGQDRQLGQDLGYPAPPKSSSAGQARN